MGGLDLSRGVVFSFSSVCEDVEECRWGIWTAAFVGGPHPISVKLVCFLGYRAP